MTSKKKALEANRNRSRKKVQLGNLDWNPNRDQNTYRIDPERLASLKESIEKNGLWDNLVVRPHPTIKSRYQLAYGHHRLVAAMSLLPMTYEVNVDCRKLSDPYMLKAMAAENMGERSNDFLLRVETIKCIVQMISDEVLIPGQEGLPLVNGNYGKCFYAPNTERGLARESGPGLKKAYISSKGNGISDIVKGGEDAREFIKSDDLSFAYTVETISEFLGSDYSYDIVRPALNAITLMDNGWLTHEQLEGVGMSSGASLVDRVMNDFTSAKRQRRIKFQQTKDSKAAKAAEDDIKQRAKAAAAVASKKAKSEKVSNKSAAVKDSYDIVKSEREADEQKARKRQKLTMIDRFSDGLATRITGFLAVSSGDFAKLNQVFKFRETMGKRSRNALVKALRNKSEQLGQLADDLETTEDVVETDGTYLLR